MGRWLTFRCLVFVFVFTLFPWGHVHARATRRPIIGVTGYVDLPGQRHDSGSGQYRVLRPYVQCLIDAGGTPIHLVPLPMDRVRAVVARLDGLLLCGGPDINPSRYGAKTHPTVKILVQEREDFDFAVLKEAQRRRIPILGICLGYQMINVARGGTLIQDIPSFVENAVAHRPVDPLEIQGPMHSIRLVRGSRLARLYGTLELAVNSYHHQAVGKLGRGLIVVARSRDGVVEAIEDPRMPFLVGVQFHPERQLRPEGLHFLLFKAFVDASVRR